MRMIDECFYDAQPTKWLTSRIVLTVIDTQHDAAVAAADLPFIYGHVGGHGTNTPRRGVCVQTSSPIPTGFWTLTQNKSQCTLATDTVKMDGRLAALIHPLKLICADHFPEVAVSDASFSLFVANEYLPGYQHSICDHTDDQAWYPSPPIFASVTFFPDGEPVSPRHTFRFQVYDEGDGKWKDLYLPDRSVCMMRADIRHRVKPPTKATESDAKRRINLTYRNLMCPTVDPFSAAVGVANHFRYYGIPTMVIVPRHFDMSAIDDIVARYRKINPGLRLRHTGYDQTERLDAKKAARETIGRLYKKKKLCLDTKLLSRSGIVLELLESVIETMRKTDN